MSFQFLLSVLSFYGVLILVNIPAPFLELKFNEGEQRRLWYAPPGIVIAVVWFVLFALLGIARQQLVQTNAGHYQWWLYALAILCASYAYYTLGLSKLTRISALWFGLIGNLVVIAFAAYVVYTLLPINKTAALLTAPVIAWTAYATAIVIGELTLEK